MKQRPRGFSEHNARVAVIIDAASHYGRECMLGIARYAREHPGWRFHLDARWPAVWRLDLSRWRGDAVIAQVSDPEMAESLRSLSIPVVNVSSVLNPLPFTSVVPDNVEAGAIGAEHLLSMHHRTYGYLGFTGYTYARDIGLGFLRRLKKDGFTCESYMPRAGPGDGSAWTRDFAALRKWLRNLPTPAGLLACNDMRARHALSACARIGLRVPEDLAIVGVGNDRLTCESVSPPLSSVALAPERIGYAAAVQTARLIKMRPTPAKPVLVPPAGMNIRESSSLLAVRDPLVSESLVFIRKHAHELIQVPDVVRAVAVSRRLLERRFLECIGHSPGEEIRRTRIELAKQMLLDSDHPIYTIASACGFSDPARLNEAFRRSTGQAPTDFRRKFRNPRF
jgi:LacI family transcriptional regulator